MSSGMSETSQNRVEDELTPRAGNKVQLPDGFLRRVIDQHVHLVNMPRIGLRPPGQPLTVEELEFLVDTAYWASLRANEGRITKASLAIGDCPAEGPILFAEPVELNESEIAKLAPAVPPGGCIL